MKISSINTQYNINTQYSQTDVMASIAKENANASKSNISSVYNSSDLNLDTAVVSISSNGNARMNAMLSRSIQLRASTIDPNLTTSERQNVNKELQDIRKEIEQLRSKDNTTKTAGSEKTNTTSMVHQTGKNGKNLNSLESVSSDTDTDSMDVNKMMKESISNILKHADQSIQAQTVNRDHVLQLL